MEEIANKVLDLLREEGMSIGHARLTLEKAIRLLDYEKLEPKKGNSGKKMNGSTTLLIDGGEVCGGKFESFSDLERFLDSCGEGCRVEVKAYLETERVNSEMGIRFTSSASQQLSGKSCKRPNH